MPGHAVVFWTWQKEKAAGKLPLFVKYLFVQISQYKPRYVSVYTFSFGFYPFFCSLGKCYRYSVVIFLYMLVLALVLFF